MVRDECWNKCPYKRGPAVGLEKLVPEQRSALRGAQILHQPGLFGICFLLSDLWISTCEFGSLVKDNVTLWEEILI